MIPRILLLILALDPALDPALAGSAGAQPVSYTYFGSPCVGFGNAMNMVVQGVPRIGSSFSVRLDFGQRDPFAVQIDIVLTGASRTTWNGGSLPFVPFPWINDCQVRVSPDVMFVVPGRVNNRLVTFAVPNGSSLLGAHIDQQWIATEEYARALRGFGSSRSGHGVLGT